MQTQPRNTFAIAPLTHVVVRGDGAEATPTVATATSRIGNPTELRASRRGHRRKAGSGSPEEATTRAPGQGSALNLKSRFEVLRVLVRSLWPGREASRGNARQNYARHVRVSWLPLFLQPSRTQRDFPKTGARRSPAAGRTSVLLESHYGSGVAPRPDYRFRPAPAKRRPSPGDDPTSASGSVPRRVHFAASSPPPRGCNQTRPLTFQAEHRSAEQAVGLGDETRRTRKQRGQQRRVAGRRIGKWKK